MVGARFRRNKANPCRGLLILARDGERLRRECCGVLWCRGVRGVGVDGGQRPALRLRAAPRTRRRGAVGLGLRRALARHRVAGRCTMLLVAPAQRCRGFAALGTARRLGAVMPSAAVDAGRRALQCPRVGSATIAPGCRRGLRAGGRSYGSGQPGSLSSSPPLPKEPFLQAA